MSLDLARFDPPLAGEELAARVLARARVAAAGGSRPSRTDRVWFSTGWRLAWAASLALTILIDVAAARAAAASHAAHARAGIDETEAASVAAALGLPESGWVGSSVVALEDLPGGDTEDRL